MEMSMAIERAKGELARLTGLKPMGVTEISPTDGGFHIRVELVELSRIPPSSDVLGSYEVALDGDGRILRFLRKEVRLRGQLEEGEKE